MNHLDLPQKNRSTECWRSAQQQEYNRKCDECDKCDECGNL
jgi:hypothetical protein